MMNTIDNYIITKHLSAINNEQIKTSCYAMRNLINEKFSKPNEESTAPFTRLYKQYNLFLYPFAGFHELFFEIKYSFYEALKTIGKQNSGPYYIGAWLNFYSTKEFLQWHSHWPKEMSSWHGFYCVDAEPSKTTYNLPSGSQVDIESKNSQLVLSPSDGDTHRTWPWPYNDRNRITIAFDIVPWNFIHIPTWNNHWIPL